jgi:murein DD-endopeptidase MepM/ murein hydrolase activator NlpD
MKVFILLLLIPAITFSQNQYSIHDLKAGKFTEDSSYIYRLPFENKKKVFLIQAYESKMSHKGEMALDFKLKKGTKICAARDGVIIATRKDAGKGGLKQQYLMEANYISVQHNDGSVAHYWHLQKNGVNVSVGDTVKTGQHIGYSGNTGYSAFPHLHFEVQARLPDRQDYNTAGNFVQIPTRFYTSKGVIYLRPGKFYRTVY